MCVFRTQQSLPSFQDVFEGQGMEGLEEWFEGDTDKVRIVCSNDDKDLPRFKKGPDRVRKHKCFYETGVSKSS